MTITNSRLILSVGALLYTTISLCQDKTTALFSEEKPLDIKVGYSFREVGRSNSDTVYFPTVLKYKLADQWDSVAIGVRGRGNFRRKNCRFIPIRVKIKKKDAKNTLFDDDRNLKLVLPCQQGTAYDQLIMREYICYQMCELLVPHYFNTRLLNIELTDDAGKKSKSYQLKGFFIEDNDNVAKRGKGKIADLPRIHPALFNDTLTAKHDLFQYLIGNTDWSSSGGHNVSVMKPDRGRYVPLAYDFDMAGLVNAPYSTVNEELNIKSVRDRVYRGYCVDPSVFEIVRGHYLSQEPKIMDVLAQNEKLFESKEFESIKKYVADFFSILKDDSQFKNKISNGCRKF